MNLASWLARAGQAAPDRPALAQGAEIIADFGQWAGFTARRAGSLCHRYRLQPGDRVAVFAGNSPRYLKLLYAIWHAGLVAVPINAKLHGLEVAYILEQSGARLLFVSDDLESDIAAHLPATVAEMIVIGSPAYRALADGEPMAVADRRDSDMAWLFYTSGTTGKPKGAMLTHGNLSMMSLAYACEVDPLTAGDPILHAAPMSHGSGLYAMAHVMRMGVNAVPESGGFDAGEIAELRRTFADRDGRRLSMFAAPTMVKRMVEAGHDAPAFRRLVYGGAPMYVADAIAALDHFGPCLAQIYGQGESPMTISTLSAEDIADRDHPHWQQRLASAGRPFAMLDVAILGEEDEPLSPDEIGEIAVRGPTLMAGYWNNPEATAKTLRGGWLHTGDVGLLDAHGYLDLRDRAKDLVISGGSNIYPREVEEVLLTHPAVREVSVIGRPDADWGEVVVAYVVGEATAEALDALCLASIARFKRPKDYVFVDALPKNNYGKVLKTELRAQDAARMAEGDKP